VVKTSYSAQHEEAASVRLGWLDSKWLLEEYMNHHHSKSSTLFGCFACDGM
jgi:hypothetical protein